MVLIYMNIQQKQMVKKHWCLNSKKLWLVHLINHFIWKLHSSLTIHWPDQEKIDDFNNWHQGIQTFQQDLVDVMNKSWIQFHHFWWAWINKAWIPLRKEFQHFCYLISFSNFSRLQKHSNKYSKERKLQKWQH